MSCVYVSVYLYRNHTIHTIKLIKKKTYVRLVYGLTHGKSLEMNINKYHVESLYKRDSILAFKNPETVKQC
jgi:hypothetical protein